ncbi:MAG: hypothetical protein O2807_05255 [bacterium]|nr:hypothetical protein [bacterium]
MNGRSLQERYDLSTKKESPLSRFFWQIVRFALVVLFLYLAYLGVVWRSASVAPQKMAPGPKMKPPAASPNR